MLAHDSDAADRWTTVFQERLVDLPSNVEALTNELQTVSRAYTDFCAVLNARVEGLRTNPVPTPTVKAASLPADILLLVFSLLCEEEPLGDLCEYRGVRAGDTDSDAASSVYIEGDDSDHITPSCPHQCDCWLVPGLEWTRVTHICARWRTVAIENAILWTNIPLNLPTPWINELILRSRSLPLNIDITCDANWDALDLLLSTCIPRIRSITAERGSAAINSILSRSAAPLLETLDIDRGAANAHPFTIPDDMAAWLPRLKHMSVPVVTFPPNLRQIAPLHLTHLVVLAATNPLSAPELASLLQALEHVQFLQLENCLPPGLEDISRRTISLPHLTTLILRGQTSSCGAVMRTISYPSSASLTLYMLPDEQPTNDHVGYMRRSGLGAILEVVGPTVFHSLHLSCVATRANAWQLIVVGLRTPCNIDRYVHDDTRIEDHWTGESYEDLKIVCMLPPILQIDGANSTHVLALSLLAHLMATLPLASLTILSLKVDTLLLLDADNWKCARWLSVFKAADKLEHLQLIAAPWPLHEPSKHAQPCPYVDLLLALSLGPHISQNIILSPKLTELSLINIDAASTVVVGAGAGRYLRTTASRVLHYFLSSRKGFGEENVHVANTGIAWQNRYLGDVNWGPLVKMGGEIVGIKEEHDQETVHGMIADAVLQSFPASDLVS